MHTAKRLNNIGGCHDGLSLLYLSQIACRRPPQACAWLGRIEYGVGEGSTVLLRKLDDLMGIDSFLSSPLGTVNNKVG